jgi:hypothetical protein
VPGQPVPPVTQYERFNSTDGVRGHTQGKAAFSFRHQNSVVCLRISVSLVLNRFLHRLRSSGFSFNFNYLLISLSSFTSCLRLLPCFPFSSIFTKITCNIRQFLHKMWSSQSAFLRSIECRVFYFLFDIM